MVIVGGDRRTRLAMARTIADELGCDLLRVDLAAVVSKYIGETEKNLARVFDQAKRASAVLFFEEADALFGKRTGVKDSRDRYANLEVSYLLQRIEAFEGLTILARKSGERLDPAFLRRRRRVVRRPQPPRPPTQGSARRRAR